MKKQTLTKQEQYNKLHAENRMKRRQAELAKKSAEEQKRNELYFRRRVRGASDKKAPVTLRTKSYYRFAKDYPGNVDTNGFRENRPVRKKLSLGKKAAVLFVSVLVFCLTYAGAKTGIALSMREGEKSAAAAVNDTGEKELRFLHLSDKELTGKDAEELKALIEESGCNAALIEFKAANGTVYFEEKNQQPEQPSENETETLPAEAAVNSASERRWATVAALEAQDIKTAAYISCYKDTDAVKRDPLLAVTDYDDPMTPLPDNDGYYWLDPFAPAVSDYLTGIVGRAAAGGFSYVVLDNLCRPTSLGLKTAFYPAAGDTGEKINYAIRLFIVDACNAAGVDKTVVMCDPYGLSSSVEDVSGRYGGELLTSGAVGFAVDARLSYCRTDSDPDGIYTYIKEMPVVSVLDSVSAASQAIKAATEAGITTPFRLWACAERGKNAEEIRTLLNGSQAEAFILW